MSMTDSLARAQKLCWRITKLEFVNIHLRLNKDDLPVLNRDIAPLTLREMNMNDPAEINTWLEIHNDAFNHTWTRARYDQKVARHPLINTKTTYFVMDRDNAVASTSIGVWRKNSKAGVGHYAAVRKTHQSLGLGKFLFVYRSNKILDLGAEFIDDQTTLAHPKSLMVHFDAGYRLKYGPDPWNTQDICPPFVRRIVNARARKLFEEWKRYRA